MSSALVRAATPLLELRAASGGALRDVSLILHTADRIALVCAHASDRETMLALCMGAQPPSGGLVHVQGADAAGARDATTRALGVMLSEPSSSVDGRLSVEDAVGAAGEPPEAVQDALADAGVANVDGLLARPLHLADRRLRARVALAAAIAHAPVGIVADDSPALAPADRADLLGAIATACDARGLALLLLTPDLGVATTMCRHVAVVLAGRVVEEGPADALAAAPRHPYTRDLAVAAGLASGRIASRAGTLSATACAFSPLCPRATERCRSVRPPLELSGPAAESVACWHPHVR